MLFLAFGNTFGSSGFFLFALLLAEVILGVPVLSPEGISLLNKSPGQDLHPSSGNTRSLCQFLLFHIPVSLSGTIIHKKFNRGNLTGLVSWCYNKINI